MKYIEELTLEQKERIPEWVDKWIKIGLKTGETDWKTFEKYILICYQKAGIKFPNKIIRVQSPIIGAFAASIAGRILNNDAVHGAVGGAVHGAVDGAVHGAVHGAVRGAVDDAVRGAVHSAVHGAVRGAVDDAVRDAVDGAVHSAVHGAVRGAVDDKKFNWHYWLGGQFWVGGWWGSPSYVSFFTDVCKLELSDDIMKRATAYRKICESVNYIWVNKNFVMVCARPKHIYKNNNGQLHCENGKAIEYPDGWGLYMLNGVRVPEWLVKTPSEKIDPALALKESNADIQREIIRKVGAERMLKVCNAKTLDDWNDPKTGYNYKLMEMSVGNNIQRKYLYFEHASMKGIFYAKPVPPECKKSIEARAWILSMVERDDLKNINEAEIIANLPQYVS